MRRAETWIEDALAEFSRQGLARHLSTYQNTGTELSDGIRCLINFSSNDYLGLSRHPRVIAAARKAMERYGAGATASRLVVGTLPCHEELEQRLASLKGYPAALLFGNGYAANMGIISALVGRGDHIFMDRLAHASLVDAAILSRARVHRFQHNDIDHCAHLIRSYAAGRGPSAGLRRLLITESVFSMDGDIAPLADLARLADHEGLMMVVDEAHATGIFGSGGAGLIRAAGVESSVSISMGTLSKALGGYGGFAACSPEMRQWLIQRARSFIYSTALPPAVVGAAAGALEVIGENPDMGASLLARARAFCERLKAGGLDTGASQSQIVPVMVGDNDRALRLHRRLLAEGILAVPIRPPTVPRGTARLRLSVTLGHAPELLDRVAGMIVEAFRAEGGAS